jgi:hypothetical protein
MAGVLNNTFLIVDLFLGACASMLLKLWLPNSRRKLRLKEDLELIGRQIADVSGRVGARPTVMLRVQQKRLLDLLDPKMTGGRMAVSPDFEDVAKHCEVAAERLKKQLELIRSVDHSAARLACLTGKPLPPSALARIETCMDRIVSLATPIEADEDDLQSVQTDLTQVAVCVDQMEQSNTGIRQFMQERLTELVGFFKPLLEPAAQNGTTTAGDLPAPAPAFTGHSGAATALALALEEDAGDEPLSAAARRFQQDLPETFHALQNPKIPETISFEALAELDSHLYKLSLIRRYLQIDPDLSAAEPDHDSPARIYPQLIDVLRLRSWDAIRTAQILIGQAEQGLYNEDVANAIRDGRLYIWCDRQVIRPNTPVEFALKFGRSTLNHASARDEFRCEWTFEHPSPAPRGWMRRLAAWVRRAPAEPQGTRTMTVPGHCWNIYQYFPQAGEHTVKVRLEDWMGAPVTGPKGEATEPVSMTFTVEKRGWDKAGPRLRLEIVSMALALAPALFALLTSAQEQVAKVSWSTALGGVFALGFGVDTLKNLLTTKQP